MDNQVKEFEYSYKPDWKVILEQVVLSDLTLLNRITRRIIIYLHRKGIKEIKDYQDVLIPNQFKSNKDGKYVDSKVDRDNSAIHMDKVSKIFLIADKYCSDHELNNLLTEWIYQENVNNISMILEKRSLPFSEVVESVKKFLRITNNNFSHLKDSRIGLRVSLIQRLLSDNLNYINIAKHHITIEYLDQLLERIIATANGGGKLGGKSAGLILANKILEDAKSRNPKIKDIKTPKCWYVASDVILEFMHYNALEDFVYVKYYPRDEVKEEYEYLEYIFKNSEFPSEFVNAINKILDEVEGTPLVIRSSSLLEDSFEASFSGKYKSIFVPNCGTKSERLQTILKAIAEVYASALAPEPLEYRRKSGLIDFREEMGILIQEVVGKKYGKYYLPCFSGIAFSYNDQPWSPRIKREDGLIRLVVGMGTRSVDADTGDYPKLFSPGNPNISVNSNFEEIKHYSQNLIDVINLEQNKFESIRLNDFLAYVNYNFPYMDKIFSFVREDTIYDPVSNFADYSKEDLVVTFNNLIKNSDFLEVINETIIELKSAYSSPIDIEFAFDGENLFLLQCRPYTAHRQEKILTIPQDLDEDDVLFLTNRFINNAYIENIKYIVYIDYKNYSNIDSKDLMIDLISAIGKLNTILPKQEFILIGPGRWGGKENTKQSIPVQFKDICNSALIVELSKKIGDKDSELSFGSHFYLDLLEYNIKYIPVFLDNRSTEFNEDFLNSINNLTDILPDAGYLSKFLKVIDVNKAKKGHLLNIFMDSKLNKAIAFFK
jgi:pyruvate,water dikinase